MAFIPAYKVPPRILGGKVKVDGMTGKSGKYVVWEYSFYFSYVGELPSWNRNFDVKIRVATLDLNPRAKERLMYYISTQLMENLDIEVNSSPDWSSQSLGIRKVGRANFAGMKYKIIDKDPMHTFFWPRKGWGYVADPLSMKARRELRRLGYA
jgi:hypothetical protein